MKKQMIITMVVAAMLLLPLSSGFAYQAIFGQSEMLKWDPDRAFNGYNLFTSGGDSVLVDMEGRVVNRWENIDMPHGMYAFLMENGNLRTAGNPSYLPGRNSGSVLTAGGSQGRIEEYDWDGNRVWYMDVFDGFADDGTGTLVYDVAEGTYRLHHDYQRIYNSALGKWTYMALIWVVKGETDADNMGVDPALNGPSRADADEGTWSPCALIEIDPDYVSGVGGDIIWYWTFADHMVTTFDTVAEDEWYDWSGRLSRPPLVVSSTTGATDSIQAHPELLDVNGMHYTEPDGPRTDYQHCNSFDYDENTGYVAINAKASNEFFVLDHDGTFDENATANDWDSVGALARGAAGDFLYRWGNPGNYYSGDPAGFFDEGDMEMYGTHDIQFILDYHWRAPRPGDTWATPPAEMALDGAQNFLLYDNGCYNPLNAGSKVIQVNPYLLGDGSLETATYADGNTMFVDPGPDALANTTGLQRRSQVTWLYGGGRNGIYDFYSSYISGTTRMPNGNTIVCAGATSHFFEIEAGANGAPNGAFDPADIVWEYVAPQVREGEYDYAYYGSSGTFRFHRFHSSHPALAGRDLTGGDTLTGREPAEAGTAVVAPPVTVTPPAPTGWGTSGLTISDGGGGGADGTGAGTGDSGGY
jgi:hypothetical protein